jgi:hypothetical protein
VFRPGRAAEATACSWIQVLILVRARELLTVRTIGAIETDGSHPGRGPLLAVVRASGTRVLAAEPPDGYRVDLPRTSAVPGAAVWSTTPPGVPLRAQDPLGVVVNRPSAWPDR